MIIFIKISEFKEIAETIESFSKTAGLIIGAIWIYMKFIHTRENHPKVEFNIDLRFVGRQENKILIELIAILENKGLVRHWIKDFTCDVLILKSTDSIKNGSETINYQVLFEKYNPSKSSLKGRIKWIEDPDESFVDSGVKQRYTHVTEVPGDTSFISIYSKFYYKDKEKYRHTCQRTFSVEQLENTNHVPTSGI